MAYRKFGDVNLTSTSRELCDILENEDIAGAFVLVKGTDSMKMTRREILEKYKNKYWYSEKSGRWIFNMPDKTRKEGRRQVSRKNQKDIENIVFDYYSKLESRNEEKIKHEQLQRRTFNELFYEYMEHKKTQVKSGTIERMMVDWEKYYQPNKDFIEKPFRDITKVDVDDFFNNIVELYQPKDKCFCNLCGIMKQTFEYAVDADYIDKSPYRTNKVNKKNIVPTRKKANSEEVFTQKEQALLTAEMEHRALKKPTYLIPWIVLLDLETGLRIGEILALRESDIVKGRLHVQRQMTREHSTDDLKHIKSLGYIISDYTKSACGDRWIPLTEKALQYLEHIKTINNLTGEQFEDYLFYRTEKVITENAVKALIGRVCKKVNIPTRSPHKLRKTYASRLYSKGISVPDISKLLGHADETTTWKHYIFSMDDTEERDKKVREALQSIEVDRQKYEVSESTKVNHNIIRFPTDKKPQNPRKFNVL
ncbi:site-specific integrase [Mediterraneibacter glycyrrhizinilyticus]|uniref:tyrosine-type recombinase/integrase n=1 Tax=Mediterraneibacter glycyrrhizinilyticus TaxID=342942 RepID=UPI0019613665|nr:site-specific integrase [Mediterraneibacter glycyrrhizinilyticus]MBM6751308.1 site-specific integrase [Mediterraneibacter glycyrrhizinilyticus]